MRRFRRVVFWAHLCTAVSVGFIVLIMSVTGVLLAYERQLTWWADTRSVDAGPATPGQPRLHIDALVERATAAFEGAPTAVTWRAEAGAPVVVAFDGDRTLLVNAWTGVVLGEGAGGTRAFFARVTEWHRWLGMRGDGRLLGRGITGAANLGFLFLVLTGPILWWPSNRTWPAVRSVLLFRRRLTGRRRDFNWHHVIGVWSALPLLIIIASASVISYPWASSLLYGIAGAVESSAAPSHAADHAAADIPAGADASTRAAALDARAERQVPGWRIITRRVPRAADEPVTYTIDSGNGGQPQRQARLVLDPVSGEVMQWSPFSSGTRTSRLRSLLRYVHTGEVAGVAGQTLAGLVSLGTALLVWTGYALALRRLLGWRARQERTRQGMRDTRSSAT